VVLEASVLLIESFHPLLPILPGQGVLEVLESAIGINVLIKTFEGTVARAGEVRLLLRCCCWQKIQQVGVELLLGYSDEGVLAVVDLQDHHVADHVAVDLLVVAYMQLGVRLPLDLWWSLVQNITLVLGMLGLVDHTAQAKGKTVLVKLHFALLVNHKVCLSGMKKHHELVLGSNPR
jgi:hypothetical protein